MASGHQISGHQIRAARALLDWTREDLGKWCRLSIETIKKIETGASDPKQQTIDAIVKAFANARVEFIGNYGVRFSADTVDLLEGKEGFKDFLDDVYYTARNSSEQDVDPFWMCCSNVDDSIYMRILGNFFTEHIGRMSALGLDDNHKLKIIIDDKPHSFQQYELHGGYRKYKRFAEKSDKISDTIFYAYGEKLAVIILSDAEHPKIIIIDSPGAARAYREQFKITWDTALIVQPPELEAQAQRNSERISIISSQ